MTRAAVAQTVLLVGGIVLVVWNPVMLLPGLVWIMPIIIGIELGLSRDRTGWLWGFFLGWLGVLILACMRPVPDDQRMPKPVRKSFRLSR